MIWLGDCPGTHGVPGAVAMGDGNYRIIIYSFGEFHYPPVFGSDFQWMMGMWTFASPFFPRVIKCCSVFAIPCVFHIVYWSTVSSSKLLQLCIFTRFSTGFTAPWYPRHQAGAQGIKIVTLWDFQPSDFSWLNQPCVDGIKSTCLTTKYPLLLNRVISVRNENQIRFLQFGGSNP